jgi:hypothetical protein
MIRSLYPSRERGGIGRRTGFRFQRPQGRVSSSLTVRTNKSRKSNETLSLVILAHGDNSQRALNDSGIRLLVACGFGTGYAQGEFGLVGTRLLGVKPDLALVLVEDLLKDPGRRPLAASATAPRRSLLDP